MKNRKLLYVLIVLVLVAAIGIGYAAVTDVLTIDGTVRAKAVEDDQLKGALKFIGVGDKTNCEATIATDGLTATLDTSILENEEGKNQAQAVFTVQNTSAWDIELFVTANEMNDYYSKYFSVSVQVANADAPIAANNGTKTVTVTVSLIKAPAFDIVDDATPGSQDPGTFTIELRGNAVS